MHSYTLYYINIVQNKLMFYIFKDKSMSWKLQADLCTNLMQSMRSTLFVNLHLIFVQGNLLKCEKIATLLRLNVNIPLFIVWVCKAALYALRLLDICVWVTVCPCNYPYNYPIKWCTLVTPMRLLFFSYIWFQSLISMAETNSAVLFNSKRCVESAIISGKLDLISWLLKGKLSENTLGESKGA